MLLFRHPYEYKLIGKVGVKANKPMIFKGLFRLVPDHEMPEGYEEITEIWGIQVYQEDGKLNPRFGAVRRWEIDKY